jgi:hypothetical protein
MRLSGECMCECVSVVSAMHGTSSIHVCAFNDVNFVGAIDATVAVHGS